VNVTAAPAADSLTLVLAADGEDPPLHPITSRDNVRAAMAEIRAYMEALLLSSTEKMKTTMCRYLPE